jgi:hypothetical protein
MIPLYQILGVKVFMGLHILRCIEAVRC